MDSVTVAMGKTFEELMDHYGESLKVRNNLMAHHHHHAPRSDTQLLTH